MNFKIPDLERDIEWLEGALDTAQVYQSDIFDFVRTVNQIPMLEHNQNYINGIKVKLEELRYQLKSELESEAADEQ